MLNVEVWFLEVAFMLSLKLHTLIQHKKLANCNMKCIEDTKRLI
jgi:hypothetical protein